MSDTYTRLNLTLRQASAEVAMNRPDRHNAFDEALVAEITNCYLHLSSETGIRAITLTGEGPSFSAGADLAWMGRMTGFSHEENLADARALQRMFAAIAHCPQVTIARVQGPAVGGGAGLVAACDYAVAAPDVRFAFSEVRLGLAPAVIAPYVIQKIGLGAARALFVTGKSITADEALRLGLVQQVVHLSDLDAAVSRLITGVRQVSPEAVAATKQLLRTIAGQTPDEAAEATVACIAALRTGAEGQEGIRAFLEKRTPRFAL